MKKAKSFSLVVKVAIAVVLAVGILASYDRYVDPEAIPQAIVMSQIKTDLAVSRAKLFLKVLLTPQQEQEEKDKAARHEALLAAVQLCKSKGKVYALGGVIFYI
jgi:hypothetical protein